MRWMFVTLKSGKVSCKWHLHRFKYQHCPHLRLPHLFCFPTLSLLPTLSRVYVLNGTGFFNKSTALWRGSYPCFSSTWPSDSACLCLPLSHTYTISILVNTRTNTHSPVSDFLICTAFTWYEWLWILGLYHAGCIAGDTTALGLLSGPFPMFENISSTLSPCWKTVLVLVGKWCGASWGAVSFSWVVFVRPFKGSPPVAIGTRKSINVCVWGGVPF